MFFQIFYFRDGKDNANRRADKTNGPFFSALPVFRIRIGFVYRGIDFVCWRVWVQDVSLHI